MELVLTEVELLLLDWQLDGPNVLGVGVFLVLLLLVALVVGYVGIRFLLINAKWSTALQMFSQADIVIPSGATGRQSGSYRGR